MHFARLLDLALLTLFGGIFFLVVTAVEKNDLASMKGAERAQQYLAIVACDVCRRDYPSVGEDCTQRLSHAKLIETAAEGLAPFAGTDIGPEDLENTLNSSS